MRYGYFDADGICLAISTNELESPNYIYQISVPDDGTPSDFWYDISKKRVVSTQQGFELLKMLSCPAVMKLGESYTLNIPENCVLEVDGTRYKKQVTLTYNIPRKVLLFVKGPWVGDVVVDVNSYIEDRLTAYPTVQEQLDMLYHLGFDAWKAEITKIKEKYPKPEDL